MSINNDEVFNMKLLVEIGHPAHVHQFKNMIWELEKKGHEIQICTIDKEVSLDLLNAYGFKYEILGKNRGKGLVDKFLFVAKSELKMLKIAAKFKPDLFISRASPISVYVSKILNKPNISFNDTEHASVDKFILPFVDAILTPSCFNRDLGKKQIRYNGYHELAYLHPNYFNPDSSVLNELGLKTDDKFIILRFVSWAATHDAGHKGLALDDKLKAVHEFEKYGRVFITSEKKLPDELEKYKISVSPENMHHLLYYATLLYGESATMASEAAVLGTHAIFCDYAGRGYTDEEEELYDLVYNFYDERTMGNESLAKALKLLNNPALKEDGKQKRKKLLADKIDVTDYMVDFIEKYANV